MKSNAIVKMPKQIRKNSPSQQFIISHQIACLLFILSFLVAAHGSDDYPFRTSDPQRADVWNFFNRNCTSFVAWRLNGATTKPFVFHNNMASAVPQDDGGPQDRWSHADYWDSHARALGYIVNGIPAANSVAHWNGSEKGAGKLGHVAWVVSVSSDGSLIVEDYNFDPNDPYTYRRREISSNTVGRFIHFVNAGLQSELPKIQTLSPTEVSHTSARLHGQVITDGGAPIIEYRFEWATTTRGWKSGIEGLDYGVISHNDISIYGNHDFYAILSNLRSDTDYQFRASVRNSVGWSILTEGGLATFRTRQAEGAAGANLDIDSIAIHDGGGDGQGNDDQVVNPGEEIDLEISLINRGSKPAHDVEVTISTKSRFVTVIDNRVFYDDFPRNHTGFGRNDFDFSVSSSTPDGEVIEFSAKIKFEGGSISRSFTMRVSGETGGIGNPEIDVLGSGHIISALGAIPSPENGTDFGELVLQQSIARTFEIRNSGPGNLILSDLPTISGNTSFRIVGFPSDVISAGEISEFILEFKPQSTGSHQAVLEIHSNDPNRDKYSIKVQGYGKLPSVPLTITSQPTSRTVRVGEATAFSITARGVNMNYQWYFNGGPIPEAQGYTYEIMAAKSENAGSYFVEISDHSTSIRSKEAFLTVTALPRIRGDLNGDGKADLLFQDAQGNVGVWFMNGENRISAEPLQPASLGNSGWTIVGVNDVGRDGIADICFQHNHGPIALWRMNHVEMTSSVLFPSDPGPYWSITSLNDMDGDSVPDLVLQKNSGSIGIWLLDGEGIAAPPIALFENPGVEWSVVGSSDLDRDNLGDVILQHRDGRLAVWYLRKNFTEIESRLLPSPDQAGWRVCAVGRFDGDEWDDILLQSLSGRLAVWFMNGAEVRSAKYLDPTTPGGTWRVVGPK